MHGTAASDLPLPPGPRGRRLYHTHRRLFGYREFLDQLRAEYGDVVYFQNAFQNCCAVFDADILLEMQRAQRQPATGTPDWDANRVAVRDGECPFRHNPVFVKNHKPTDFIETPGLNQADGEPHQRMVRLVEPAFARERLDAFCDVIIEEVLAAQEHWHHGKVIRAKTDLTRLCASILLRYVVGRDLETTPDLVTRALLGIKFDVVLATLPFASFFKRLPYPDRLRNRRAIEAMNGLINESMRRAREFPAGRVDAVTTMVHAMDDGASGPAFSDKEIRDLTYDLMLGSIDPLKVTLLRCIAQLAAHPEVRTRLEREVDEVAGNRPICPADYDRLPYARAIFHETLRLGPPGYAINRTNLEDYVVRGCVIPKGTWMEFCFGADQCSDEYWEHPGEFRPERWLDECERAWPPHVYSAFGYRPHACVGWELATMTAVFFMACTAQRYRLDPRRPVQEDLKLLYGVAGPVPVVVNGR